jgi:poly(A) polymerase
MTHGDQSSTKQSCRREDALDVLRRLRDAGHVAYFAGGCVRDELLGLVPKDYDVATDAPPTRVREIFRNTQSVGAAFGVILVRFRASIVEVATFRAEGRYLDGRRPTDVRFTTAQEDAKRRDFTINGLFLDPINNEVIDYVRGQQDLRHKLLRAIGDPVARFEEDHLRMLRAVRFASRFDLAIDPATADAIKTHAEKLKRISPERIAEELRLTLMPPTRTVAWPMLRELGLLRVIFRLVELKGQIHAPSALFSHVAPGESIGFGLALAAAVLSIASEREFPHSLSPSSIRAVVRALRQTLRVSNEESDELERTLLATGTCLHQQPGVAALKRLLATSAAESVMRLLGAIGAIGYQSREVAQLLERMRSLQRTVVAPPPLLTGDDLVAMGFRPGPQFKRILDRVYDEQLEDRVTSRDAAMELARTMMRPE